MDITKEEAEKKIEELKIETLRKTEETKTVGIAIKSIFGNLIFQSTKMTMKEAVIEAVKSGSNLSGSDLSDSNLRGSDLSGSDLSGSDLSGSNLSGSNLRGSDLSDSNLRGSDLSGSNLSGSNLSGSDLRGVELQNAKFYGRGGHKKLKRSQLPDFLLALGFDIDD